MCKKQMLSADLVCVWGQSVEVIVENEKPTDKTIQQIETKSRDK